jgi:hypothetical protein
MVSRILPADAWDRPYSRQQATYPAAWMREAKFWPSVGRVDNAWGDRNSSALARLLRSTRAESSHATWNSRGDGLGSQPPLSFGAFLSVSALALRCT